MKLAQVPRVYLLLGAVALLLTAHDFFGRVLVPRDDALRGFAPPSLSAVAPPPDAAAARAAVARWVPGLVIAEPTATDPNDPASWTLRLTGTFRQRGQPFAVIIATPSAGGPPQTHRVVVGDAVHGRTVTQIGPGSVTVSAGSETQELLLFQKPRG